MAKNEFYLVKEFLCERFKAPLGSVSFLLYFIFVTLLVGLIGSFLSSFDTIHFHNTIDFKTIAMSLIGYSVVLLSSSSIELIFIQFKSDEKNKYKLIKKAITMLGVTLIILSLIFALLVYLLPNDKIKFFISLIFCLIALFFWWIANSKSLIVLNNTQSPTSSEVTGGDERKELEGQIPENFIS